MENSYQNKKFNQDIKDDGSFLIDKKIIDETKDNYSTDRENFKSGHKENINKNNISPKLIFVILLILATGTLIYGFASLSNRIYGVSKKDENQINNNQANMVNDLLELQNMDTDKDGLTDYDEMYIYKTSPYLADTDSDGYLDKDEIDSGHDPLCPVGEDCNGTKQNKNIIPNKDQSNKKVSTSTTTDSNKLSPEVLNELKKLSPQEIRDLILKSGQITKEELDKIDDTTLMKIYTESLGQ